MINVRKSVFETNSSSSHSLVFSNKDRGYDYDLPVDEDGILTIPFGEFGWGPNLLRTPIEKLSYYITDHTPWIWEEEDKDFDSLVEDMLSNNDSISKLVDLIYKKCPKVKGIKFTPASDFYPLGYVDHESVGTSNDTDVENLIFNNSVLILLDNDNSYHFADYIGCGWHDQDKSQEDLFEKPVEELRGWYF